MWTAAYIVSIVVVNWLFVVVPGVPTPMGELYLATLVVGAVFVLRDYAQREVGHFVLLATLVAGVITWYMTTPELALASITAFAISEMADWAVFSFTRKPLQKRILISSLISVPLDSLAFLYLGLPDSGLLLDRDPVQGGRRGHRLDAAQDAGRPPGRQRRLTGRWPQPKAVSSSIIKASPIISPRVACLCEPWACVSGMISWLIT